MDGYSILFPLSPPVQTKHTWMCKYNEQIAFVIS